MPCFALQCNAALAEKAKSSDLKWSEEAQAEKKPTHIEPRGSQFAGC